MIRAIVFDLDKCLAPPEEIGRAFFEPVFSAIREANAGYVTPDTLEAAFEDVFRFAFDDVAARHGFTPAMIEAGWRAFRSLRMPGPLYGYGDLDLLGQFEVPLVLVTTGFRAFQESKVDALGIRDRFVEVLVDDIDGAERLGKERIFAELLERRRWRADETLVVGDNPESEIAAGDRLGMPTIQIVRPKVPRDPSVRWHADGLAGVLALLEANALE